jgi:hypothetical protein
MALLPLSETERQYLKQLIRETIDEVRAEKSKARKQPNGSPPDPVILSFAELYFSPTFEPDILGYDLPYDLYCSFPSVPPITRVEFARRFAKACLASDKLGVVERARTSQAKGLLWIRFATDAEIRDRRVAKD